jgi:serine/threonine-protein kinase
VAALPTPDPKADARGAKPAERLRLLRPLGVQSVPAWAALDAAGDGGDRGGRLVVADRAHRKAFDEVDIADWIRDARRLMALDHPNVARVRDVIIRADEVLVVTDYVDGVRWREFSARTPAPSLEVALRVFVDVLAGLNALHNLRDTKREPLRLVHGALTPDNVVVGLDGVTRILGSARPRSAATRAGGSAYLAPEVLLEDDTADARADTYGVAVMLWEALSGQPFLPGLQPAAIVTQLLSGRVPPVTVPAAAPWAAPLVEVVKRALSPDPGKRFVSGSAMAAELRRVAGTRLPASGRVAVSVREAFGDAVRARREDLERGVVRGGVEAQASPSEVIVVAIASEPDAPSDTAPTVPPPPVPPTDPAPRIEPWRAPVPLPVPTAVALPAPPTVPAFVPMPMPLSAPLSAPLPAPLPMPLPMPAPEEPPFTEATTAAPLLLPASAVATPIAVASPLVATGPRRRGRGALLYYGIASAGVVVIGALTWFVTRGASGSAPREPAAHAAEAPVAPEATALPAPALPATESPTIPPAPTTDEAPAPEAASPSGGPATPPSASHAVPRSAPAHLAPQAPPPAWARPHAVPVRRSYDPQGI